MLISALTGQLPKLTAGSPEDVQASQPCLLPKKPLGSQVKAVQRPTKFTEGVRVPWEARLMAQGKGQNHSSVIRSLLPSSAPEQTMCLIQKVIKTKIKF